MVTCGFKYSILFVRGQRRCYRWLPVLKQLVNAAGRVRGYHERTSERDISRRMCATVHVLFARI